MDIKIKQIDWKETVEYHVNKSHLSKQKILEMMNKKGNFNRDLENPDVISLTQVIQLSEALDHNFFYDLCDIETKEARGVQALTNSKDEINLILAKLLQSKEEEIKELKSLLNEYKKTGT